MRSYRTVPRGINKTLTDDIKVSGRSADTHSRQDGYLAACLGRSVTDGGMKQEFGPVARHHLCIRNVQKFAVIFPAADGCEEFREAGRGVRNFELVDEPVCTHAAQASEPFDEDGFESGFSRSCSSGYTGRSAAADDYIVIDLWLFFFNIH